MIIREFKINPINFQEINLPIGSNIVNALVKLDGSAVLIVEVEESEEENFARVNIEPEIDKIGVYIVQTDDPIAEAIPEDYRYVNTLKMGSELGLLLFHVYVQELSFEDLGPGFDSPNAGNNESGVY